MKNGKTIQQIVEERVLETGAVDNFWCIDNRITTRLGAVICRMRDEGWHFDDEKSGYINVTKNWRYVLKQAPAPKTIKML